MLEVDALHLHGVPLTINCVLELAHRGHHAEHQAVNGIDATLLQSLTRWNCSDDIPSAMDVPVELALDVGGAQTGCDEIPWATTTTGTGSSSPTV